MTGDPTLLDETQLADDDGNPIDGVPSSVCLTIVNSSALLDDGTSTYSTASFELPFFAAGGTLGAFAQISSGGGGTNVDVITNILGGTASGSSSLGVLKLGNGTNGTWWFQWSGDSPAGIVLIDYPEDFTSPGIGGSSLSPVGIAGQAMGNDGNCIQFFITESCTGGGGGSSSSSTSSSSSSEPVCSYCPDGTPASLSIQFAGVALAPAAILCPGEIFYQFASGTVDPINAAPFVLTETSACNWVYSGATSLEVQEYNISTGDVTTVGGSLEVQFSVVDDDDATLIVTLNLTDGSVVTIFAADISGVSTSGCDSLTATNSITAPSCTTESAPTLGLNGTAEITGSMDGMRGLKLFSSSSSAVRRMVRRPMQAINFKPSVGPQNSATVRGKDCGCGRNNSAVRRTPTA